MYRYSDRFRRGAGRWMLAAITMCSPADTTKIRLPSGLRASSVPLPSGDYEVTVRPEERVIILAGQGGRFRLEAQERASKAQVSRPAAQLRPVEGERRFLVVARLPPASEWVGTLVEAP